MTPADDLHRDVALEAQVAGAVHIAHATAAQVVADLVGAQAPAALEQHEHGGDAQARRAR